MGIAIAAAACTAASGPAPPGAGPGVQQTAARAGWDGERAGEILTENLRRRGLPPELAAGAMLVVRGPDDPDAEAALAGEDAATLHRGWPDGAALVVTPAAGSWWVWEYGASAPADRLAVSLMATYAGGRS